MENYYITIKNIVLAVCAALGSIISNALGGWDVTLQVLVGFMVADYLTGLVVAGVFHKSKKSESGSLESRAGFQGLIRKCAILMLVLLGVMLDHATHSTFIRPAICFFFIANEGLSILENLGLMGVPYPAFLKNMLEALKKNADDGGDDTGNDE